MCLEPDFSASLDQPMCAQPDENGSGAMPGAHWSIAIHQEIRFGAHRLIVGRRELGVAKQIAGRFTHHDAEVTESAWDAVERLLDASSRVGLRITWS
jgi:hypothetical protein